MPKADAARRGRPIRPDCRRRVEGDRAARNGTLKNPSRLLARDADRTPICFNADLPAFVQGRVVSGPRTGARPRGASAFHLAADPLISRLIQQLISERISTGRRGNKRSASSRLRAVWMMSETIRSSSAERDVAAELHPVPVDAPQWSVASAANSAPTKPVMKRREPTSMIATEAEVDGRTHPFEPGDEARRAKSPCISPREDERLEYLPSRLCVPGTRILLRLGVAEPKPAAQSSKLPYFLFALSRAHAKRSGLARALATLEPQMPFRRLFAAPPCCFSPRRS